MPGTVLSTLAGGVRTITLNRPKNLNAINSELLVDFKTALTEAAACGETRVVLGATSACGDVPFRPSARSACCGRRAAIAATVRAS